MSLAKLENLIKNKIIKGIEGNLMAHGVPLKLDSEREIERFTELNGGETLLKVLGYKKSSVQDHPVRVVNGTVRVSPDYGLKVGNKHVAILDVKAPRESLDRYHEQILSYCQIYRCPIGVLFNGKGVRLYVNTSIIPYVKCKQLFHNVPVYSADITSPQSNDDIYIRQAEVKRLAQILFMISVHELKDDPIVHAKNILLQRKKEMDQAEALKVKEEKIAERLRRIKANPSGRVLLSIKKADARLADLKPTVEQMRKYW